MTNRSEIESVLVTKATADASFRARLIADPRASIDAELGQELPAELAITVFEETPERFCLVLPSTPEAELSDSDLAGVAGGKSLFPAPRPKENEDGTVDLGDRNYKRKTGT